MIPHTRQLFNAQFSEEKYRLFIDDLNQSFQYKIPFRVAESPVFIDRTFKEKLFRASAEIIDFILRDDFKKITERAIPHGLRVPNETDHTLFLALDYAVVKDEKGELQPRLIEMQGFPSVFGFQDFLSTKFRQHYTIPQNLESTFDLSPSEYQQRLKHVLLNGHDPENVVLLEIEPLKQNTAIDFMVTQQITGILPLHIGDVLREGRKLFYKKDGKKTPIISPRLRRARLVKGSGRGFPSSQI